MSESLARQRLTQERKDWRKNHPPGFYARPETMPDGTVNLFRWRCGIPGPENTPWEGGMYKLEVQFPVDYPMKAPECMYTLPTMHCSVYLHVFPQFDLFPQSSIQMFSNLDISALAF
jgi:ubiquitin-conjugating enzyme E2 I